MITESDSFTTLDLGKYYAILPQHTIWKRDEYMEKMQAEAVPLGFKYNSGTNSDWLNVEELRSLIREHVDPNFSVAHGSHTLR
jgi:hypothetical protein